MYTKITIIFAIKKKTTTSLYITHKMELTKNKVVQLVG